MRARTLVALLLALAFPALAQQQAADSEGVQGGGTAPAERSCANDGATAAFRDGFAAQRAMHSDEALRFYDRCLDLDPSCIACIYERGWSHWSREEWSAAASAWRRVLELEPEHDGARTWLPQARQRASEAARPQRFHARMGTRSTPKHSPVSLELIARFQNYDAHPSRPSDHYDRDIYSPKSARFSRDGSKVYINSLEGMKTVVYDARALRKLHVISHVFGASDAALFHEQTTAFGYQYHRQSASGDPNEFGGRPVESALSHGGRYLWIPYYRRDFDRGATSPSAVAIIDTATDQVVRVMPTGPIPKYVAISPDDHWAAIVHWGDNTIGLIDISSGNPQTFHYDKKRLVVGHVLSQKGLVGKDRDKACGFCLRGSVFTPDGRTLLVARMGGGGIAGFDVESRHYLGTLTGLKPTPRHLLLSPDGAWLYLSSNVSGYVSRTPLAGVLDALHAAAKSRVPVQDVRTVFVGGGARTIDLTPDGRYLFAAVNLESQIAVIDSRSMTVVARVRTDPYPVGLAVSPDGKRLWTTAQGRKKKGGNSVCVYSVRRAEARTVARSGQHVIGENP